MSTKVFFSNRIYKNTLPITFVDAIHDALFRFNRAKQFVLNTFVKEKRSGQSKREKSSHLVVKETFQLDDYYTNSAVQAANAQLKSLDELKKLYIKNKTAQIRSIKRKLKKDRSRLTTLRKIKTSFIKDNPTFPKNAKEQKQDNFFVVNFKKKTDIYYHAYQFEHTYLDPAIHQLQTRIGFLTSKRIRKEEELKQLRTHISSVVFGSKKLFKSQYTKQCYIDDHETWQEAWQQSRYQKMALSGRKDAGMGNFVFQYDIENQQLHFKTPSGTCVNMENIHFPYGQEKVEYAVHTQQNCKNKKKYGKPIAWSLEDHGDYYIVKCIVDVEANPHINYSKADGIIGIDCNVDHFAITNINAKGQLISSCTLPFNLEDKTSGQITKIMEAETITVVNIAQKANKPITLENIDTTTSKVAHPYGNKKANHKMSMFAYKKMITAIKSRAEKKGVAVYEVNPAYTSQIGKIKYMKRCGISIHQAASYVIARRAMGFQEKLPPVLDALLPEKMIGAHHWTQWKYISKPLKEVRTHAFYLSELFDVDRFHNTGEFFVSGALTGPEQKGLSKLESRKTAS
ncbi:IS200/IS605 family accessory protein TnpB-related protein [Virgibacillus doumboii]|uniref:IS200/IS605 family accessory protein TnpB-related protein n=1 Tax=Virgibacillus doumboii TaxID=2697503 RepID=UPI001FE7C27C|nr:IS200/IS605 family accessory protein TnpB-related protein [Virgibacillus doumboii]